MTETGSATVSATTRDAANPDSDVQIFAAIDCGGTRGGTTPPTAPAPLGALWSQRTLGGSESISSFANIGARANSAEWRKFLLVNAARFEAEAASIRREQNDALVQLVATASPPSPEALAGLSAGVKLRTCPKCNERPVRGRNRGECKTCHAATERERRPIREAEKQHALRLVKARGLKVG